MSITKKLKDFIAPDDEILELTEEEVQAISQYENPRNKNVPKMPTDIRMVLFEPRSFDEAEEIASHLKQRRAAVVNLHRLIREDAQRCIDVLTGVVFALDGTIQKIGHNVVLCTPKSIGVDGEITLEANE